MVSGDLWLSSADSLEGAWARSPRRVRVVRELRTAAGRPCWLVELDEPIPTSDGSPLSQVVLANRLVGDSVERLAVAGSHESQRGWVEVYVVSVADPDPADGQLQEGQYAIEAWAEVALDPARLPKPIDEEAFWADMFARIKRFIDEHGHSRFPEPYFDADGKRLDVIVENIRWHHAGKGGVSPGPFPGIDYATALDALPGWTWAPPGGKWMTGEAATDE